jgi:hypothetical protein
MMVLEKSLPVEAARLTVGKRNVYLHPSIFKDPNKLFIFMGHEFIHTLDHDRGVFEMASDSVLRELAQLPTVDGR